MSSLNLKLLGLCGLVGMANASSLLNATSRNDEKQIYDAQRSGLGNSGMALADEGSFSYYNASRMALGEKTSFAATLAGESVKFEKGKLIQPNQSFRFSMFSLGFSMWDGALGLAYVQPQSNETLLKDSEGETVFEGNGGVAELVASGAWSFFDRFSVGGSFHYYTGKETRTFYYPNYEKNEDTFDLLTMNVDPWSKETIQSEGWYPRISMQWEERYFSLALGFAPEHEVTRSVSSVVYAGYDVSIADGILDLSEINQYLLEGSKRTVVQSSPVEIYGGIRWNISRMNLLTFDFHVEDASGSQFKYKSFNSIQNTENLVNRLGYSLGMGYQLGGSTKPFDSYLEKTSIRIGGNYEKMTYSEHDSYMATVGFGLPLGGRGAKLEVAFNYGQKIPEAENSGSETAAGFQLTFLGVGNWGQPSRRYR